MQIVNMYKPIRPRRNSLPSLNRNKTKTLPKTDNNLSKSAKVVHESNRPKSKTPPSCVKQLNYNESQTSNFRNVMDHSLSDGDDILDERTTFQKVPKKNQVLKDKRPSFVRSQPIDAPSKCVTEVPLNHTPPSYESPQKYGPNKKFKEGDIEQFVIEKYALLKQLMIIDERCSSPNGDSFYAGAKFNNCPSPGDLPLPPMQWLNSCQAEAKTMQKSPLIFNITI